MQVRAETIRDMVKEDIDGLFERLRYAIGSRLREERERLSLSQQGLADWLHVQRQAVLLYEGGARSPLADQLAILDHRGGDACYVITGKRHDDGVMVDSRHELMQAMAAVDAMCDTMSYQLDGQARLKTAFQMIDSVKRAAQSKS